MAEEVGRSGDVPAKVRDVYEGCGLDKDMEMPTLQMLSAIQAKREELLTSLAEFQDVNEADSDGSIHRVQPGQSVAPETASEMKEARGEAAARAQASFTDFPALYPQKRAPKVVEVDGAGGGFCPPARSLDAAAGPAAPGALMDAEQFKSMMSTNPGFKAWMKEQQRQWQEKAQDDTRAQLAVQKKDFEKKTRELEKTCTAMQDQLMQLAHPSKASSEKDSDAGSDGAGSFTMV